MPHLAPTRPPAFTTHELGAELEQRVVQLWWRLTRELPSELSRTAASVLAVLGKDGPQRVTALAEHESIAQPSMTLLVQRLERNGLVDRREDPQDRRACLIVINAKGEQAMSDRSRARAEWLEARLEQLTTEQRDAIAAALSPLEALLSTGAGA